jgi:hypothetical protein
MGLALYIVRLVQPDTALALATAIFHVIVGFLEQLPGTSSSADCTFFSDFGTITSCPGPPRQARPTGFRPFPNDGAARFNWPRCP